MKFRNLLVCGFLCSGSLHASILVLSNGLASPGFVQNFSNPSLTPGTASGVYGAPVTNQFSNVSVSSGYTNSPTTTALFYDPDGGGSCAYLTPTATVNMPANCVGNFLNNNLTAGQGVTVANDPTGNPYPGTAMGLPTINIGFLTGQTSVAFVMATAANGNLALNTLVQVYSGSTLLDSNTVHTSYTSGSNGTNGFNWVTISGEELPITSVVVSSNGMDETGQNGANGVTQLQWAAQISNIEGNLSATPEPATIGMFGFGLIGIGYLVRRRKA